MPPDVWPASHYATRKLGDMPEYFGIADFTQNTLVLRDRGKICRSADP